MTERQIENRIKKLQAIEVQQKVLEEQAETLKAEIKADMESKGLDGKALKAALPEIYNQYCKVSASRRFTVA